METREVRECQERFLANLGTLERVIRSRIGKDKRSHDREDLIAEALAYAWREWRKATARGKDPAGFATTLAVRSATYALRGQKIGGKGTEAKSSIVAAAVCDRARRAYGRQRRMGPDGEASFRIDHSAWLGQLSPQRRQLAILLGIGFTAREAAERIGIRRDSVDKARRLLRKNHRNYFS